MAQQPPAQNAPPPGPSGVQPEQERPWAVVAHVGSFLLAFIRQHAVESLNFQITAAILTVVFAILIIVVIGIFLLIALGIAYVVLVILASVAASRGQLYRYPVSLRLVR
jgi:uncharacterized protein